VSTNELSPFRINVWIFEFSLFLAYRSYAYKLTHLNSIEGDAGFPIHDLVKMKRGVCVAKTLKFIGEDKKKWVCVIDINVIMPLLCELKHVKALINLRYNTYKNDQSTSLLSQPED
jgi:hypothetical protein